MLKPIRKIEKVIAYDSHPFWSKNCEKIVSHSKQNGKTQNKEKQILNSNIGAVAFDIQTQKVEQQRLKAQNIFFQVKRKSLNMTDNELKIDNYYLFTCDSINRRTNA